MCDKFENHRNLLFFFNALNVFKNENILKRIIFNLKKGLT